MHDMIVQGTIQFEQYHFVTIVFSTPIGSSLMQALSKSDELSSLLHMPLQACGLRLYPTHKVFYTNITVICKVSQLGGEND